MTIDHLHNKEESGNDDIGEVTRQEGQEEGGQDAVLCAHTVVFFIVFVLVHSLP